MKNLYSVPLLLICFVCDASELELFTETFPPYNFIDQKRVVGINADILSEACRIADVKCSFSLLPWIRALKNAYSKQNSGVFSTSRTIQREGNFVWVGPLVYSNACFYRLKSRADIVASTADSLTNYTVGIPRGDIYERVLQSMGFVNGKNYITYSRKHDDTRMFKLEKLDLIMGSSITLASQLQSVDLTVEDVVPVFELNDDFLVGNYLALNKQTNPEIVEKLQNALELLKKNGRVESIISKYIGVNVLPVKSYPLQLERCVNGKVNY